MFRPKRSATLSSSLHSDASTPKVFTDLQDLAKEKLIELFPEHVCFAFQFSRVTRQTGTHWNEFSLFVCLKTRNMTQEHLFRTIW
ncbi:MAG: hypothetical protein Q8L68_03615 [Methylococcales bacterium]|nr:hypothetical protein [Methylococcales bacterium]